MEKSGQFNRDDVYTSPNPYVIPASRPCRHPIRPCRELVRAIINPFEYCCRPDDFFSPLQCFRFTANASLLTCRSCRQVTMPTMPARITEQMNNVVTILVQQRHEDIVLGGLDLSGLDRKSNPGGVVL